MILTLARKSLAARWGRNLFILAAVAFGVSFVSGSFVLADSLRATFDDLFAQVGEQLDLVVRTELVGTSENQGATRDPVAADLVGPISEVPGVGKAQGEFQQSVIVLNSSNKPLVSGPPMFGTAFPDPLGPTETLVGDTPSGPDETVMDGAAAKVHGYQMGDSVKVVTASGNRTFKLVGVIESNTPTGGAVTVFFDRAAAPVLFDMPDTFDSIVIDFEPGADEAAVKSAVAKVLPANVEVVTGEELANELNNDLGPIITAFGTGLLIFALITAFVSGFIINNIFGITIGQRLRELALLRAIGANTRQVRNLIVGEAGVIAVVGTLIGIFGGVLVAKGIVALLNTIGGGFPEVGSILAMRTVIVSIMVGVGTVLLSAWVPARRASKIPPVAAMRPEIGFQALSASRRLIGGAIVTGIGIALFLIGLFVRPGGEMGLAVGAGLGALITFLGVTSLSTTVANPVSRFVGWPIARLFGMPGMLARDNAARSPRRTARTASALMIGVAIISAAGLFASSLSASFNNLLERAVKADFFVTDVTFAGLPTSIADSMAQLPELSTVSSIRMIDGVLESTSADTTFVDDTSMFAIDPATFEQVVNLDVKQGEFADIDTDGIAVYDEVAEHRGLAIGDPVDVVFQNGTSATLTVRMLFGDNSLGGDWYITADKLAQVSKTPKDLMIMTQRSDDASPEEARAAIDAAVADFPQAQVQDNAQYRKSITDQINVVLYTITVLLSFAIALAFFGIAVTLALSVFERIREIGLLRAVGMTRRQLRRAVRWEAVIVAVFGVVVGATVGLGMGTALVTAVPDSVISTISFPTTTIAVVVVLAVVAALVAALYPAIKASRMDVLRAISAE